VQAALDAMVALKLEPEKNAEDMELFKRYRSAGYPTLLFATADGEELDRLGDFLSADEFLAVIERIKAGDTHAARLARLDQNPGSFELFEPVYEGLMVREDFSQIYSQVAAFQRANPDLDPDPSMPLLQKTYMRQHDWLYGGAARVFHNNWEGIPEIEAPLAAPSLMALLEESPAEMPHADQAERLRNARADDAVMILGMMAGDELSSHLLFSNANFAFDNGRYDLAVDLYEKWFDKVESPHPGDVNLAAWNLFLCRRDLDQAIAMARFAYSLDNGPGVADTLAQLLYSTGEVEQAIEIERKAAAEAGGGEAEGYAAVVARMEAGEDMVDQPDFETYPN